MASYLGYEHRPDDGTCGKWTAGEDSKLEDAVQTHGGKHWGTIAALVPGRTKIQCNRRWKDALDPSIDRTDECTGKWTAVEDSKLKDAVQTHDGKNWGLIAALVPGRTKHQCNNRWHAFLDPIIDREMDVRVNGQQSKTAS
jgi:myb proto-oncogene protein